MDPTHVIVLDETSTPTTLTSRRARSPWGERAVGRVPRARWETVTLLATMTLTGMGPALQFPGTLDRAVFETFVEQLLVPQLHPGQIVSWDNLSVHKSVRARDLIEAAGCRILPTPRYSPDCNPIEPAFSKLKAVLRRAEARTFDAIVSATGGPSRLSLQAMPAASSPPLATPCHDNLDERRSSHHATVCNSENAP